MIRLESKEFARRIYSYNQRIQAAELFLSSVIKSGNASSFIVCRAVTYEPADISASGVIRMATYEKCRVFNSQEEASRFAVRCHNADKSAVYIAIRMSAAMNHHISWIKKRKQMALDIRASMNTVSSKEIRRSRDTRPWWQRV